MIFKNLAELEEEGDFYWDKTLTYWHPLLIHSKVQHKFWDRIKKYFPTYQLYLFDEDDNLLGLINSVPFYWDNALEDLPNGGWDWMVSLAVDQFENKIVPNTMGGLQVVVFEEYRKKGYSQIIVNEIKRKFKQSQLTHFVIPIRPILKEEHPKIPMDIYMNMKMKGQVLDPWIRLHLLSGAEIIKICHHSMVITGTKDEWESWMNISIKGAGHYPIEGGLIPLYYDDRVDIGYYREPNIWISYS